MILIATILFLLFFTCIIQIYAKGFVQWRPLMTVCKVKTTFSLIGNFHTVYIEIKTHFSFRAFNKPSGLFNSRGQVKFGPKSLELLLFSD